jgi:multidrug efflux pump subunit AcrB
MDNGKKNPVVESVISNVAIGANDPNSGDQSAHPELGRIQVSFVEFAQRNGVATRPYLDSIRTTLKNIPGAQIAVDQEQGGPPTDPPVNIEIASEDFDDLTKTATALKNYLDSVQVPGVEELKMDVDLTNPEITLNIDREKANTEGLSTYQIGNEIRTAVFGREVSKVKEGEDEYKIQLRDKEKELASLTDLLNMNITFRSPTGSIKTLPIGTFVNVDYTSTVGSVKRKKYKRVITLTSNILSGYTTTTVNQQLTGYIQNFKQKP